MKHHLWSGRTITIAIASLGLTAGVVWADDDSIPCNGLPSWLTLQTALASAVVAETSGLGNQMWATLVDRDGNVCAVAFSGVNRDAQWTGSRIISAQKANTGNAFALDSSSSSNGKGQANGLALSTASLYSATQDGGSLFGLQFSNPLVPDIAYVGPAGRWGTASDPLVHNKIGGVNVFGGGLALYGANHVLMGGVGVSGDTSCTDHMVAWRVRHNLGFDHMAAGGALGAVPGPASLFASDATHPDNIIYDITANPNGGTGNSASGFGHPKCLNTGDQTKLPAVVP
jgi:uncharacterized protein GlcG (DUF336 family)